MKSRYLVDLRAGGMRGACEMHRCGTHSRIMKGSSELSVFDHKYSLDDLYNSREINSVFY